MKERKDLERMSAAMMKMRTPLNMIDGDGEKTKTYDGGYEAPGMHDAVSKTVSTQGGARYGKGKTKTLSVTDDTPYHGRESKSGNWKADRETLTRTTVVNTGYGPHGSETTKVKKKAITKKRAARIKKRIRKHDASIKTNPYR